MLCSQNTSSVVADDWGGFESYAANTNTTSASKENRRGKVKAVDSDDFGGLDVKSMKGTNAAGQAPKKPEDDAWDLLNN